MVKKGINAEAGNFLLLAAPSSQSAVDVANAIVQSEQLSNQSDIACEIPPL